MDRKGEEENVLKHKIKRVTYMADKKIQKEFEPKGELYVKVRGDSRPTMLGTRFQFLTSRRES
jgi:hypothetical protein